MSDHRDVDITSTQNMTDHLQQRVTVVERNLDGLREQAAHTQAALSSLRTESSQHTRDLHDIKEAIQASQRDKRTNWEVIAAWLGVAVIIATLAFAPVYRDLHKLEGTVEQRTETIIRQAQLNGRLQAQIESLQEEVEEVHDRTEQQ